MYRTNRILIEILSITINSQKRLPEGYDLKNLYIIHIYT